MKGSSRRHTQGLIVLDFDKHETRTLYGQEAIRFQQQAADQWCSTHSHAIRGLVSKLCCERCLAEAAEKDKPA